MNRPIRITVAIVLFLALVAAGYGSGKAIGSRLRPRHEATLSPWIPGSSSEMETRSTPTALPSEVFASVLDKVQQDFTGGAGAVPVSNARLNAGALGRMAASLHDPRTRYLDTSQTASRIDAILGKRHGIGADLAVVTSQSKPGDLNYSFLTVTSVAPDSPAEHAGIHSGDRITELNGQWIIAYPVPQDRMLNLTDSVGKVFDGKHDDNKPGAASQIKPGVTASRAIDILTSGAGNKLRLTIQSGEPTVSGRTTARQVNMTTDETISLPLFRRLPAHGVSYLRVANFNSDVSSTIHDVLSRGQDWAVGLIIDLRQNSGGVEADSRLDGYHSALDLIGKVAEKAVVGQIERKPGVRMPITVSVSRPAAARNARVAVLIDGGTRNIGEMAAAGMRDAGGAKLIGSHTSGDDVLTFLSVFKTGGAIELTSAHLLAVEGRNLSAGVTPDIPIDSTSAVIGGPADPALLRAIRYVSGR